MGGKSNKFGNIWCILIQPPDECGLSQLSHVTYSFEIIFGLLSARAEPKGLESFLSGGHIVLDV